MHKSRSRKDGAFDYHLLCMIHRRSLVEVSG